MISYQVHDFYVRCHCIIRFMVCFLLGCSVRMCMCCLHNQNKLWNIYAWLFDPLTHIVSYNRLGQNSQLWPPPPPPHWKPSTEQTVHWIMITGATWPPWGWWLSEALVRGGVSGCISSECQQVSWQFCASDIPFRVHDVAKTMGTVSLICNSCNTEKQL